MASVWSLSSSFLSFLGRGEVNSPQNTGIAQQDEESAHHAYTHPTPQQTHAQNGQHAAVTHAQDANAERGVNHVSGGRMGPPPTAPGGLRSNALPQMYQPVRSAARSTSSVSSGHSCQAAGGIFAHLLELAGRPPLTSTIERERFGLFAQLPTGKLEEGWINLHLLLWKHLIALIVAIELEGEKYAEHKV